LLEWLSLKTPPTTNVGEAARQKELSYTAGGECKLVQPPLKKYGGFLKTKHRSDIWSSNTTPRDKPKGM
jgi:hypothetical protein